MGAKKKKATPILENSKTPWMPNGSITARNLRSKDLKGVIFGCTHHTIQECLSRQLFGLPASHYAYVRNIYPGMALFLFNYSDRKLHGIFEAKSSGQMRISPYAWSSGDSEPTQYPAQVPVQYRVRCQPLMEEQFKPIIEKNYYIQRHFWFELDHKQTTALLALFSSMPFSRSSLSHHMMKKIPPTNYFPTRESGIDSTSRSTSNFLDLANTNQPSRTESNGPSVKYHPELVKSYQGRSFASLVSDKVPHVEVTKLNDSELQVSLSDHTCSTNSSTSASLWDDSGWLVDAPLFGDIGNWEKYEHCVVTEDVTCSQKKHKSVSEITNPWNKKWEQLSVDEDHMLAAYVASNRNSKEFACTKPRCEIVGPSVPALDSSITQKTSARSLFPAIVGEHLHGSSGLGKRHTQTQAVTVVDSEVSFLSTRLQQILDPSEKNMTVGTSTFIGENSEMHSPDPQYILSKLVRELESLKEKQILQTRKVNSLEHELAESKKEVLLLRRKCKMLESVPSPIDKERPAKLNYRLTNGVIVDLNESVFLVGGCDGASSLSSLNLYKPSCDTMTSLKSMSTVRHYAPATKLNGDLYVVGGVDNETATCYDTVASYNPSRDEWTKRPLLKRPKGNLATTSCYGKIFAIGGGSENDCFSEVEMFDGDADIWIQTRSMRNKLMLKGSTEMDVGIWGLKFLNSRVFSMENSFGRPALLQRFSRIRFAPAAAEINGIIYVVGGYDGDCYLKSAERFDYREQSWTRLESMRTARGCHSLAVLNEKIYALGGYDGTQMVQTVELFDPRNGKWVNEEEMNIARGYAGAAVLGNSIYIMGGMKDHGEILDTVECYREGKGWQITKSKAIGKRCFFSAICL